MNRFLSRLLSISEKVGTVNVKRDISFESALQEFEHVIANDRSRQLDDSLHYRHFLKSASDQLPELASSLSEVTNMWLQFAAKALGSLPYIIAGIQHIHGDAKSGADKKHLAMEALGLSYIVAQNIDPAHAPQIDAATNLFSTSIDGLVTLMHSSNESPSKPLTLPAAQ